VLEKYIRIGSICDVGEYRWFGSIDGVGRYRLDETQAEIKISGRNINNLRYADDTTLMAESEEELKNLLMKVKGESDFYWLKTEHAKN